MKKVAVSSKDVKDAVKKEYTPPVLFEIGRIEDITQGSTGDIDDGDLGLMPLSSGT